jgi:hypothetical protein
MMMNDDPEDQVNGEGCESLVVTTNLTVCYMLSERHDKNE